MKSFKTQKISKQDVYVRYLIAAALGILLSTGEVSGFPLYFLLIFTILLVSTGVVERSFFKAKFYPNKQMTVKLNKINDIENIKSQH